MMDCRSVVIETGGGRLFELLKEGSPGDVDYVILWSCIGELDTILQGRRGIGPGDARKLIEAGLMIEV